MTPMTVSSEAGPGPRLLQEHLNTNRRDFKIGAMLDELDMKDDVERNEFQHFLRDYLTYDPDTNHGFPKDELAELTDNTIHCYAEQFMDEAKFKDYKWPAGHTYFPPSHLQSDPQVSRHRKKWTYDNHRRAIINIVAQVMITQRNNLKKKVVAKRAAPSSTSCTAVTQQEDQGSDSEYAPPSAHALKRPRKQGSSSTPKSTAKPATRVSRPAPAAAPGREHPSDLLAEPTIARANGIQSPPATTGFRSGPSSILGEEPTNLPSPSVAGKEQSMHNRPSPSHEQQPSTHNNPDARPADMEGINAAKDLAAQALMVETPAGKMTLNSGEALEQLKVQYFEKGLHHARRYLKETCMDMQLAAEDADGPEAEHLDKAAKGFFNVLRDFNKAMQKEKDALPRIVRKLDME